MVRFVSIFAREHEESLAVARRQLNELREAGEEEAGKREYEIKVLKDDLEIAKKTAKVDESARIYVYTFSACERFEPCFMRVWRTQRPCQTVALAISGFSPASPYTLKVALLL